MNKSRSLFPLLLIGGMMGYGMRCRTREVAIMPGSTQSADTLWVEKCDCVEGWPETSVRIFIGPDTLHYFYGLKTGAIDLRVFLDGDRVPERGWLVMDRNHRLTALGENLVIWRLPLPKHVYYGCPAVADDGTIYITTGIFRRTDWGSLYAVSPSGTLLWSYDFPYNPYSPVLGEDGTVYVQDFHNTVYAFTAEGILKWTFREFEATEGIFYDVGQRIPAIGKDGTVYVVSDGLYALDPTTGRKRWRFNPLERAFCRQSPVIGEDGTIYFFLHQDDFYAVNSDGTEKWHARLDHADEMTFGCPAIGHDGTLYVGTEWHTAQTGAVYAFGPDGTQKWKVEVEGRGRIIRASPAIAQDGTVYVTTKSGGESIPALLLALSLEGSLLWTFVVATEHAGGADDVYGTPTVGADGLIYFGSENSYLYAVRPDGTLAWRVMLEFGMNWSSAALLPDGTLYIGTHHENPPDRGNLYAIRTSSAGYAASPWPRFRQNHRNNGRFSGE